MKTGENNKLEMSVSNNSIPFQFKESLNDGDI